MKDKRIVFIAKTDINTDGRIINQINILLESFKGIFIDFIILPDRPINIHLGERVKFSEIKCKYRNSSLMRIFTILEFTVKTLEILRRLRPEVIHVQDSAGSLPILIYKKFNREVVVVYDDHEIPNQNATFFEKLNVKIENELIRSSNVLIEANEERLSYIKEKLSLKPIPSTYFLNLPFELGEINENEMIKNILVQLDSFIDSGGQFIIHQGPLKKERGRELLSKFAKCISNNQKILLIGGKEQDFKIFLQEFNLSAELFWFVGTVDYKYLSMFWKRASYSVIIYLPTYLNNKFCAPNRLYLSYFNKIPAIVNKSNPVLSNFVTSRNCGIFVEDLIESEGDFSLMESIRIDNDDYQKLMQAQSNNLISIYKNYI